MKNESADQRTRRLALKREARQRRRDRELPSTKKRRIARDCTNQNRRRDALNSTTRDAYNAKRRERAHTKLSRNSQRDAIRTQHALTLREAHGKNDTDAIFEIDKMCFVKESLSRNDVASYVPGARGHVNGRRCIVLLEDDVIVACMLVRKTHRTRKRRGKREYIPYLQSLAVLPSKRNHGYARDLLNYIQKETKQKRGDKACVLLHVRSDNASAIYLYVSAGFQFFKRVSKHFAEGLCRDASEMMWCATF